MARHETVDRELDRNPEVEREVGADGEVVQVANPLAIDAPRHVAGERGKGIPVGKHDHSGFERRNDLVEQPIGEVGGVQQAERHRCQRVLLLSGARCGLDEG